MATERNETVMATDHTNHSRYVIELYGVSSDPRLLTVSAKTEGGRGGGRTIKRFYDQHEPVTN
jgi:hypothetical protein